LRNLYLCVTSISLVFAQLNRYLQLSLQVNNKIIFILQLIKDWPYLIKLDLRANISCVILFYIYFQVHQTTRRINFRSWNTITSWTRTWKCKWK